MIRNPKAFEAWSICSCWAHSVITELEMLPPPCLNKDQLLSLPAAGRGCPIRRTKVPHRNTLSKLALGQP